MGAQPPAPVPPAPIAPPITPQPAPAPAPLPPAPIAPPLNQPQQQPGIPPVPGAQQPPVDPNAAPAWADQLMQTVTGLKTEFDQFRGEIDTTPPEQQLQPGQPGYQAPEEWRPKTGAEIQAEIDKRARQIATETLEERDQRMQQDNEAYRQQVAGIESNLDTQVAQLEQLGYVPKIVNNNDKNDPGRRARAELFGYAYTLGTTNLGQVAQVLHQLHQGGQQFDVESGTLVRRSGNTAPGATAPIAGGTPSGMAPAAGQPSRNFFDTHNLDEIAEIAARAIQ